MSTALQPLSQNNRDISLDILRGFALAGVLLTFCATDVGAGANYKNNLLDEVINWPKYLLIENRMYTMLIILFGIGFHVQLEKAKQKNVSLVPAFTRRLIGLLAIGFIHAILLSTRDVLMFYGIAGAFLLPLRNLSNRWLFIIMGIVFLVIVPVVVLVANGYQAFSLPKPNNYIDHLQHNWQFFKLYHQIYPIYCEMLFHFMLGFIIGRAGVLQKMKADKKFRRRLLIISLIGTAIMIPVYYFWIINVIGGFFVSLPHYWQKLLLSAGYRLLWQIWMLISVTLYVTTLISVWTTTRGKKWLSPLAAFGQMTLSNYLIQSIVLVPYLLAFDKYDNLPPFNAFILFLIVLALQLLFSIWWMTRYTMGPFEWLLRSFTYWKWQRIKKPTPAIKNYQTIFS
ncbi:MAG TPA: DUF418 domain-containing protein [Chitinophagaceae bacterium]|jgi:uncharacterized protein|nr:DUF418 domain-containing protein [Chitinophagaceae bacterium]